MYVVIFEVKVKSKKSNEYLTLAAELRKQLMGLDGFISIERFSSLVEEGKMLSLSFWRDEKAIEKWKQNLDHMKAQEKGRNSLFEDYRIRVAEVVKDYTYETSDF